MSRRRTLRPEEEELWHAVARTATPMHAPALHRKADVAPAAPPATPPPLPSFGRFKIGEKTRHAPYHDILPPLSERLATAPVVMDKKSYDRMSRGKLSPEARMDLHGMTVSEAHPELIRFILNAHSNGLRLVLVITGKGKQGPDFGPIPMRYGVLKHQVPQWLHMAPLGPCILQVSEAHLKHGGAGAYYVYLRRAR